MSRWRACEETELETVKRPQRLSNSAQDRQGGRPRVLVGRARAAREAEAQLSGNGLHQNKDQTEISWKCQKCEFFSIAVVAINHHFSSGPIIHTMAQIWILELTITSKITRN